MIIKRLFRVGSLSLLIFKVVGGLKFGFEILKCVMKVRVPIDLRLF